MLTTNQIIILLRVNEDKSILNIDKTTNNIADLILLVERDLINHKFETTIRGNTMCNKIKKISEW